MKMRTVSVMTSLVLACLVSAASAGLLNIDINGIVGSETPAVYTGEAAAGGGIWNVYSIVGLQDPAQSAPLVTSTGASTNVRFDLGLCKGGNTWDGGVWRSGNDLMDDFAFVKPNDANIPQSVTFTLTGLAAGGSYDLYLYGLVGGVPSSYCAPAFTIGSQLKYLYNPDSFIYVGGNFVSPQPLAEGRDYVHFSGLMADGSGTITGVLSTIITSDAALDGLQLVGPMSIPEPATATMGVCGLLSLVAYAWRKWR